MHAALPRLLYVSIYLRSTLISQHQKQARQRGSSATTAVVDTDSAPGPLFPVKLVRADQFYRVFRSAARTKNFRPGPFFPGKISPGGPFLPVILVRRTKISADQKFRDRSSSKLLAWIILFQELSMCRR